MCLPIHIYCFNFSYCQHCYLFITLHNIISASSCHNFLEWALFVFYNPKYNTTCISPTKFVSFALSPISDTKRKINIHFGNKPDTITAEDGHIKQCNSIFPVPTRVRPNKTCRALGLGLGYP